MIGRKFDTSKPRWSLLPFKELSQVVEVLTLGSKKYSDDNWKYVDNSRDRYFSACMRHLTSWWNGEIKDKESGQSHLAHAICCLLFLLWFENN